MLRLTTAIILAFYVLLSSCIATNTTNATNTNPTEKLEDIRLVLMGLVLATSNKKPINAATIVLIDLDMRENEVFLTGNDGTFQFRLDAGKNYKVMLRDPLGNDIGTKSVSTVNKSEPEIMHIMFEVNSVDFETKSVDNVTPPDVLINVGNDNTLNGGIENMGNSVNGE